MKRFAVPLLIASALAVGGVAVARTPAHFTGQALAGQAHVSLQQARGIALAARPGVIVDQELEKEGGGSGLRYSFDIKSHGRTYEVGVDAASGKVLENGGEAAAKEAAEVRTEARGH